MCLLSLTASSLIKSTIIGWFKNSAAVLVGIPALNKYINTFAVLVVKLRSNTKASLDTSAKAFPI